MTQGGVRPDDGDLLIRARSGDRAAFSDLVRIHQDEVYTLALRLTADRELAADVTQEAFVRALRYDPDRPKAWLFRVAANLAKDEARTVLRRKRHLTLLKSEVEDEQKVPTPEEVLLKEERWVQLRRALDKLNERDQEVLLLWDAGLSYREIAEITDLAPGAIGTTLARARQRLVEAHGEMEKEYAAHN